MRKYYVYILASRKNGTLYIGMTGNLTRRIYEHRQGLQPGFSRRHSVKRLVWYEVHDTALTAIQREKNLKEWKRAWKVELIEKSNPDWNDLYRQLGG